MVFQQIGQRIRQERTRQRFTQEQLAEMAGVNESYIGQIERGAKNPSLESIIKIANALGVSLDYILRDVTEVRENKLLDELVSVAGGRNPDEIRLLLNINKLVVDYLDKRNQP